jgi:predicted nucleic acid-binding protein
VTETVVDSSALIFALTSRSAAATTVARGLTESHCHAPHLIDAECGSALRKLVRRGEVTDGQGYSALVSAASMIDVRYPHDRSLSDFAWQLRNRLSFYDAIYVALAIRLNVPLTTCDRRLANAPGLPCRVELVG